LWFVEIKAKQVTF